MSHEKCRNRRSAFQSDENLIEHLLGIAEQHSVVFFEEERIVDTRVT
jgi:hypothetical protein